MTEWTGIRGAMAALAHRVAQPGGNADAAHLLARADAWRVAFAAAPGERWAIHIDSTQEFAAALFGAWHAGKHVVLPGDTRPDTLIALRAHTDGWAGELPLGVQPRQDIDGDVGDWPPLSPDDTGVTLFTSGSTGAPEAIHKRLAQLDSETAALEAAFGAQLPPNARLLATVSHQHIYGLLFCVLWPLAAGRALPQARLAFLEEVAAACGDAPVVLVSSPAHLRRMPESLDWSAARAAVCAVFSSGGPLPPEAADDALRHLGQSPIEVLGSSETGGIAWRQRARQQDRWTALPGVAWRLQDGFLAVRSAHLPTDDWHVCADRALADGEQGFVLAGRADRIAKIEEKRVSLTRIEQTLAASPLVQDARVVLVDLDVGTRVAAAVVLAEAGAAMLTEAGRPALIAAMKGALANTVDLLALPRRWHLTTEALPCNAQGKTTEAMLRDLFRQTLPRAVWIESSGNAAAATLDVSEHLAIFDGHFPGTPIVPGVAQLDWVMALAPQRLPVPARERFLRLDVLKFQGVIRPGSHVRLDLEWLPDKLALAFRLTSAAGPHASGRIVFRRKHG
ncbi:AMP-binding protein [Cupriavidus sp. amp6]|uniref:AMP-binding protein n=1 Tax=Cupriavidus sp. amp6 TaxID=388051 RepID=UPI0004155AB7|nr:AMP-binding protein [Cupriavidus sp. amp6]